MKNAFIKTALYVSAIVVVFAEIWLAWQLTGGGIWFGVWVFLAPIATCYLAFFVDKKLHSEY